MSEACSGFDPVDDLVVIISGAIPPGRASVSGGIHGRISRTGRSDPHPFSGLADPGRAWRRRRPGERATGGKQPRDATVPQRLGDYVLLRAIGSGGMGIVYEAVQESLGRHVVPLKVLPFQHLGDATRLERFRARHVPPPGCITLILCLFLASANSMASTTTQCSLSEGTDWTPSCAKSPGCSGNRRGPAMS